MQFLHILRHLFGKGLINWSKIIFCIFGYKFINTYNDYGILNENQVKLFIKEMEYIPRNIRGVLSLSYNEQGIYPEDSSISKYPIFFIQK